LEGLVCLGVYLLTPWAAMSNSVLSYITRSQSWEKFENRQLLAFAPRDDASCRDLPIVGKSFMFACRTNCSLRDWTYTVVLSIEGRIL